MMTANGGIPDGIQLCHSEEAHASSCHSEGAKRPKNLSDDDRRYERKKGAAKPKYGFAAPVITGDK